LDRRGKPHIVFCHEWKQIGNGTVCEMELAQDLSHPVSKPRQLWAASDFPDVADAKPGIPSLVTDGPFLYRCKNGELVSIWSSFDKNGYVELLAKSDNGDIDGNWSVCPQPISAENGGHGMIFHDFAGDTQFIMHKPNTKTLERPVILPIKDADGFLQM
jgi:hypothetical protein